MRVEMNTLTPELFLELYTSVSWEPPCMEQVRKALENTIAIFTVYYGEKPVGMARLIGDGGMSFYIKDFAVCPSYQSKGVGTLLIESMENYIRESIEPDWAVSLELISSKEAVPFYKSKGFEERPCEWDGPGMFKMIKPKFFMGKIEKMNSISVTTEETDSTRNYKILGEYITSGEGFGLQG